jgi:hypothetical protein
MKQIIISIAILIFVIIGIVLLTDNSEEGLLPSLSGYFSSEAGDDDDDDEEGHGKQQLVEGSLIVSVSKETQQFAGIKTSLTENMSVQSEDNAFSSVIDIQELLDMRSNYRNVKAQREVINTSFKNTTKQLERLKVLHKEASNISARELQQARSKWEEDKARIHATDIELQNIRDNMVQKWNTEITELALKEESEIFDRLISREEYIILVSLKAEQQLSPDTAFVFVNREDDRQQARKAYFISAAPFSDNTLQGETYFFRTNGNKIRIGMRLYVWLPNTGFTGEGVNIPTEAIVWYAGKPWAYIQIDEERFSRRSLLNPIQTSNSWLVKENFEVGEKIVISGAQTLLSEEFKYAIPDEDDD